MVVVEVLIVVVVVALVQDFVVVEYLYPYNQRLGFICVENPTCEYRCIERVDE